MASTRCQAQEMGADGTGSPIVTGAKTRFVVIITIDGIRQDSADSLLAPLFEWAAAEAAWFPNHVNLRRGITDPNHMILLGVPDAGAPLENWQPATLPFATERIREQWGRGQGDVVVFTGKEHVFKTCLSSTANGDKFRSTGFFIDTYPTQQGPDDSTAAAAIRYITAVHPVLSLINLSQFDWEAHGRSMPRDSTEFIGIPKKRERDLRKWKQQYWPTLDRIGRRASVLARRIVSSIEADSVMGGHTTYIITTDHGRHDVAYCLEHGLENNFNHAHAGACCPGCRDIWCIILGPDTRRGVTITEETEISQIEPTYRLLLGYANGDNHALPISEAYTDEIRRRLGITAER